METLLHFEMITRAAAIGLSAIFAVAGIINAAGLGFARQLFQRWNFPLPFQRSLGILQLFTALFLSLPQTRIWGVVLAGFIMFCSVVTLLNHRQYAWSVPAMLLLAALVPAALA